MPIRLSIGDQDAYAVLGPELAAARVKAAALEALLGRCVAVMTPEQLQQAGISPPPAAEVAALQPIETVEPSAQKNGARGTPGHPAWRELPAVEEAEV